MRRLGPLVREVRHQVHTIELPLRPDRAARRDQRRRQDVELEDRLAIALAGRDLPLPLDAERHPDAPLQGRPLPTPQRIVQRGVLPGRAAVVGQEEDQRVLLLTGLAQLRQDAADRVVHGRHHGRERAPLLVLDAREASEVPLRRLERNVLGVERQVQEERPVARASDEVGRPLGVGIRGVEAVVDDRCHMRRLLGVDEVRRVEEGAGGDRSIELIEATRRGRELRPLPQMPLADRVRRVSERSHALGEGRLFDGQAELAAAVGRGAFVPFMAEARRISPGQQTGARR